MISFDAESELLGRGLCTIGIDEAGRGALAGPVVAAAVVLDPKLIPAGIDDSKRLTSERRSEMAGAIKRSALAWGVGVCSAQHIDQVNILQATYDAMHEAIDQCHRQLGGPYGRYHLLVDGNRFRRHAIEHTTIVSGDATVVSIAAASILAKTHRDHIMTVDLARQFPAYGFDRHKGYGTSEHRTAIIEHGPCSQHRQSFLRNIIKTEASTQEGTS